MIEKLGQREKRTLKIGAVGAAVILLSAFGTKWLGHWRQARESLELSRTKLKAIALAKAKQAVLMKSTVPVFQMPEQEETQKFLFRDKLNEQLKKAGIKGKPLEIVPARKSAQSAYKMLFLKYSGKCQFRQTLDLLTNLYDNPYLVGIEEFRIECDPKKRQEVKLDLTVSTFVK